MRRLSRLVFAGGLTLSACSPYVYQDEIHGFSTGVDNLNTAYQASATAVDTAVRAERQADWVSRRAPLRISTGCVFEGTTTDPCAVREAGVPPPAPTEVQAATTRGGAILPVLKDYAAALAMITDAQDRMALDKATSDLKDSVVALAQRIDASRPDATPITARAGAITGLFNQIAATGLDQRRFEALRAGVISADDDIAVLAPVVGQTLRTLAAERFRRAQLDAVAMQGPLGPTLAADDYRTRMTAFEAKVAEMQQLKTGNPQAAANQMAKAHRELRAALEDPSRQIAEVTKAVQAFVAQAKAVRTAFAPPVAAGSAK